MAKRAGSIADENEQFDTRALIRLSTWGIAAVVAVTTTIFAARSELGTKRVHAAVLSITASPADPPSAVLGQLMARTADVERESRRLSETVRSIGSERERLQVRVGMVEREMGDLTGSITKSLGSQIRAAEPKSAPQVVAKATPVLAGPPPVILAPTSVEAKSVRTITAPPLVTRSEQPPLAAQSSEPEPAPPAPAPTAPVATVTLPDLVPLPSPRPSDQTTQAMRNTPAPPAAEATPPAGSPATAAKPDLAKSDMAKVEPVKPAAQADAKAEPEPQPQVELGLDLGPALTMARLRERWTAFKSSYAAMAEGMRPVVSVREVGKSRSVEMRLVVGPVPNVYAAATMCSALSGSQFMCQPAVFDGQRLAQR